MNEVAKDRGSWNYYLDWLRRYAPLTAPLTGTADLEDEVAVSIQYLRSILGEEWPKQQARFGHPLLGSLLNISRSSRLWLIDFTQTLRELISQGFGDTLVNRLKNRDRYLDAEAEIMFASRFSHAGIQVLSPRLTTGKNPDFKIELDGVVAFVEVSNLHESTSERLASRTFDEIMHHGFRLQAKFPEIVCGGRIYKPLMRHGLEIAKSEMTKAFRRAGEEGVVKIRENGLYEIDVFHQSVQGLRIGFQGPEFEPSGASRIILKIREKVKQIPRPGPGFLAFVDQNLVMGSVVPGFYDSLASQLCQAVQDHERLAGLVLTLSYLGSVVDQKITQPDAYSLLRTTVYDNLHEDNLLIPNPLGGHAAVASSLFHKFLAKDPLVAKAELREVA